MYRYDSFDREFVRTRVEQFRRQVARRIDGLAHRRGVQAAAADERPLPAASRLHASCGHPLRNARQPPDAAAGPYRGTLGQGLRALHDAAEHAVQLAQAEGCAGHPRRPGRCGHARDPDIGELRAQRHGRPFRGRGGRRNPRSAPDRGTAPAVVDGSPGIRVPAEEVQDRGEWLAGRPGRHPRPRHRPVPGPQCGRRGRLPCLRRRRAGPHAGHRIGDSRLPARGRPASLRRVHPADLQHPRAPR